MSRLDAAGQPFDTFDVDIARGDLKLLRIVDRTMAEAAARAGSHLSCRPGCTPCCIGPFPVSALDAWRLRRGMAELGDSDPERAQAVAERARASWAAMQASFPGDPARGVFNGDEEAEQRFCATFEREPCPALDPEAGTCDLYESRPTSCRTFGPPMRLEGEDLPPCDLCFVGASGDDVDRARATLDVGELEEPLVEQLARQGTGGDTIVAAVLAVDASRNPGAARA